MNGALQLIPFEAGGKHGEKASSIAARHCRWGYEGIEKEISGDKELNLYALVCILLIKFAYHLIQQS